MTFIAKSAIKSLSGQIRCDNALPNVAISATFALLTFLSKSYLRSFANFSFSCSKRGVSKSR